MRWMDAKWGLLPVVAATLVACGGGGDTTKDSANAGTSVTLSGSAATGLALGNATVAVKCETGSGNATTNAAGAYVVTLNNASLPCVLKVTSADSTVTYHSVAAGNGGGTVVANITPLTELVVAQATGMTPSQFFNNFTSAQSQAISDSSLQGAVTAVVQALNSAVSLGSVNPLTSELVPATTANPGGGDLHDQLLDQLQAAIANAGTTLTTLTQSLTTAGGGGDSPATNLGAALVSDIAAAVTGGFYNYDEEDEGVFVLSRVSASTPPVNGVYNVQFQGRTLAGAQWQTYVRNTDLDDRYLTAGGWVSSGSALAGSTIQQTGTNTFQFRQGGGAIVDFVINSSTPSQLNLSDVSFSFSGTATLPAGSRVFNFRSTLAQELYELNGGEGFFGVTSLSDFRTTYSSTGSYLTWMAGGTPDQLGWRFGPNGLLLLYTGVNPYCSGCPEPVALTVNGSWTVVTRNNVQIMELTIPAAAGSTWLAAGEKIIYSVIPGGNVQEGIYSPAGTLEGEWLSFNQTAMNAILAALSRPPTPAN